MTREPAEPLRLDYLIKAGTIHSMTGQTYRSVGIRGPEIVAVSPEPGGLDDLAGRATVVADAGDLTVLPAFSDSHEHLMEASRNTLLVPVDTARSIAEFTALVRDAARAAPPGKWILTSIGWNESNLAENRMPTGAELDAAAPDHPVFARRGGHLAVANSAPVGIRFSARFDSFQPIEVRIHFPGGAARAASRTRAVKSAMDRAVSTGTSSVLRLASIRCSWESLNAGSTVRSPASATTVARPARASSPPGSGDTATISGPRMPTER